MSFSHSFNINILTDEFALLSYEYLLNISKTALFYCGKNT